MGNLKVAAVSMASKVGRISDNLEKIKDFTRQASRAGADIICFPELSVSGYVLEQAESVYSREESKFIVQELTDTAVKNKIILLAGFIEIVDNKLPFISHMLAGPAGPIGIYRKTHISPPECGIYCPGHVIQVFQCKEISFGVQLCYESHFPEVSTLLALQGAEIIFMPHASPRGKTEDKIKSWMRHLPARAFDNGVFVIACNQTGRTEKGLFFPGGILVIGPDGNIIALYDKEEESILYIDLDMELLKGIRRHRMKYFIPHRRPELYAKLTSPANPSQNPSRHKCQ